MIVLLVALCSVLFCFCGIFYLPSTQGLRARLFGGAFSSKRPAGAARRVTRSMDAAISSVDTGTTTASEDEIDESDTESEAEQVAEKKKAGSPAKKAASPVVRSGSTSAGRRRATKA